MSEHKSPNYAPRTFSNARDSEATIRFAVDWGSAGELCTLKAIRQYNKPYFDVDFRYFDKESINLAITWIHDNSISVLNVAGNSTRTHRTMEVLTEAWLSKFFEKIGYERIPNI